MGTGAKVDKLLARPINCRLLSPAFNFIKPFFFIRVVFKELVGFFNGNNFFFNCQIFFNNLFHFRFNLKKIFFRNFGVVHRCEASGELHGIIRPREFTQDDAHIYCTPEQIKDELKDIIDLCFYFYDTFGLKLDHLELSTRPEKSIGSDKIWNEAEKIMKQVLKEQKVPHQINEGDGAFYGPKIDFHLKDSMGRTWQCATIQLDFAQPENFNLTYVTDKGTKERPVMIHRVIYGSVERFLGILIEHYAGAFPAWLAPVQAVIIPITTAQNKYSQKIREKLFSEGLRVEIDSRNETMQKKIKEAEEQKINYMLIVGNREVKQNKISVRQRGEKDLGPMTLEDFLKKIKKEIEEKA